MRDGHRAEEPVPKLPESATSRYGYTFSPASDRWQLDKDHTISLEFLEDASPETELGCRLALTHYASKKSAAHTKNMRDRFAWYMRDTESSSVTSEGLINWRSQLGPWREWILGSLKGYLLTWQELEYPGMSDEVAALLNGWRLAGNEKGRAVAQSDPELGPLTDTELLGILEWANRAVSRGEIDLETYAYLLTVMMTARRPTQIAALRGIDLIAEGSEKGKWKYEIRFPRAKQRGSGFREQFRELAVIDDLYLTLRAQHEASVAAVKKAFGYAVSVELAQQIPIFINKSLLNEIPDLAALHDILMGEAPDRLHAKTDVLKSRLKHCQDTCTARSERTGEPIHLTSMRFRYTLGTNLRRDGFGHHEIAFALDQSDTQQVGVYAETHREWPIRGPGGQAARHWESKRLPNRSRNARRTGMGRAISEIERDGGGWLRCLGHGIQDHGQPTHSPDCPARLSPCTRGKRCQKD